MRQILIALLIGSLLIMSASVYVYLQSEPVEKNTSSLVGTPYYELVNPTGFINTNGTPIRLSDIVGKKVVLLEFMRYDCVNCQRSFPYMVSLYEKYKDKGLEIVSVHTPQFAYEREEENVRNAMKAARVTYPVVLDNDLATWQVYGNRYWPRTFIIDLHGTIVYDHIGSGAYEETEEMVKTLLETLP